MPVLCGYIDLNTRICKLTPIYAGIVATLGKDSKGCKDSKDGKDSSAAK